LPSSIAALVVTAKPRFAMGGSTDGQQANLLLVENEATSGKTVNIMGCAQSDPIRRFADNG
jgi:hypothetical protein